MAAVRNGQVVHSPWYAHARYERSDQSILCPVQAHVAMANLS